MSNPFMYIRLSLIQSKCSVVDNHCSLLRRSLALRRSVTSGCSVRFILQTRLQAANKVCLLVFTSKESLWKRQGQKNEIQAKTFFIGTVSDDFIFPRISVGFFDSIRDESGNQAELVYFGLRSQNFPSKFLCCRSLC